LQIEFAQCINTSLRATLKLLTFCENACCESTVSEKRHLFSKSRKNCKFNPNCLAVLGERFWMKELKGIVIFVNILKEIFFTDDPVLYISDIYLDDIWCDDIEDPEEQKREEVKNVASLSTLYT
jgi:hypothetical protein